MTAGWLLDNDRYQVFALGTHLMAIHTSLKDIRRLHTDVLLESLDRWQNSLWQCFAYGNKANIQAFAPVARRHLDAIANELIARKSPPKRIVVRVMGGKKLDSRYVKLNIDPIKVYEHYLKLERSGGNGQYQRWKALCPWHADKNPSLVIYPEGRHHCYACLSDGDVYSLIMELDKVPFPNAVVTAWELGRK